MKIKILLTVVLAAFLSGISEAQTDSAATAPKEKKYVSAFGVYAEFGVLSNSSFTDIRKSLKAQGVNPFNSLMASIVLARRIESEKWVHENRLILMNSTRYSDNVDEKRASLRGLGIGFMAGRKIVNNEKWNVYIPVGVDLMVYQLGIKSNYSASLGKVLANPATYRAIKLYTGSINVNAGLGIDYKTNILPKIYDKFYISAKASYHLPVTSGSQWKGENVQVNDLAALKHNQLYASIGIVMVPNMSHRRWKGMH